MQILIIFLALLLTGCADEGSFDFSRVETNNTTNITINVEPNEGNGVSEKPTQGSGSNPICLAFQTEIRFKPISESDGNLVILFPSVYTEIFKSVKLTDNFGNVLELGKFTGFGNGERQHYRFTMPGASYPSPLRIVAESMNGECTWIIEDSTASIGR
jgi:hypothetical protein